MSWVRIDDQFFRHPKATAAGRDGRSLFIAGLCYCASQLTDGHITKAALMLVAADAGVKHTVAKTLVECGLWVEDGRHGFFVHDFLEYNPSADEVRVARAKRAEAGSKGGKQRASNAQAKAQANAWVDPSSLLHDARQANGNPGPGPHPQTDEQNIAPPVNLKRAIEFESQMGVRRLDDVIGA